MTVAVVAEKPSVARSLAEVLGATQKGPGCRRGNGYVVTWAIGHLVGLAEPHELDPEWKPWRLDRLPLLPREWELRVYPKTADHFAVVAAILNADDVERVVCATDAGREGELIFRYIYRQARCAKPVQRLWVSSLTAEALKAGFRQLQPGASFDNLAAAAEARSRADWLVGMNFTRAYTLRFGPDLLSVGRVQTPTLAMVVAREHAVQSFVATPYCEVEATFGSGDDAYTATWFDPTKGKTKGRAEAKAAAPPDAKAESPDAKAEPADDHASRLPADGALAEAIHARCAGQAGQVLSSTGTDKRQQAPLLYDLTELQRHANRLYGMTAQATLKAAQGLYEQHQLLSYPRTDSRYLSTAVAAELRPVVAAVAPRYGAAVAPGTGRDPIPKRFVDDAKVTDHHAIIPTDRPRGQRALAPDEERIYDLVCRRLLQAWHADFEARVTRVVTGVPAAAAPGAPVDRFRVSGTVVTQRGWKVLDVEPRKAKRPAPAPGEEAARRLPEGLAVGQRRPVAAVAVQRRETKPPKRFTDATLLTAMESAGRTLDSRELEEAMRERGLGTPATRAAILETLCTRGYVVREGKSLHATAKGMALIEVVDDAVKSPQLTGEWELALKRLEHGEGSLEEIVAGIERFVVDVLGRVRAARPRAPIGDGAGRGQPGPAPPPRREAAATPAAAPRAAAAPTPRAAAAQPRRPAAARAAAATAPRAAAARSRRTTAARGLTAILKERFGHPTFRPQQKEACRAVVAGGDALVVMPPGSGKSLCVELAGVARGGTTLLFAPSAAAVEDRTAGLRARGFRAEQLHAGCSREAARAACRAYLDGALGFFVVAVERLGIAGGPEMLAKGHPALIAIEDAQAVARLGHHQRADYRLLETHLPLLRPAPVLALTPFATARVQDEIAARLGLGPAGRFVHGFARDTVALEVIERPRGDRVAAAVAALTPAARTPAVVWVPTRAAADEVAAAGAGAGLRAAALHAGLAPSERGRAQAALGRGDLDVVAATFASGLRGDAAIRTVVLLACPAHVEAYVQALTTAGSDGRKARAILYHDASDRGLHEAFQRRDYPDAAVLTRLRAQVPAAGIARAALLAGCGLPRPVAEPALLQLARAAGVTVAADEVVHPGSDDWAPAYEELRSSARAELDAMLELARAPGCRLVALARHLGETRAEPCGACDACRPDRVVGRPLRAATAAELALGARIVHHLARRDGLSTNTLLRQLAPGGDVGRREFERLLEALARAGALTLRDDEFEKDGERIRFRRAVRNPAAPEPFTAAGLKVEDPDARRPRRAPRP